MRPHRAPKLCPTCGHPVHIDKIAAALTGKARKLYEIVNAAGRIGISRNRVRDLLYDDPTGGPLSSDPVSAWRWIVNGKLYAFGLEIRTSYGRTAVYTLERIE